MLEGWLEARDGAAVRSAWTALAPRVHEVAHGRRELTMEGAALLAAAMLGERADWIVDLQPSVRPDFHLDQVVYDGFFDHVCDFTRARSRERWNLHERHDGTRGVQVVNVVFESVDGRPEGVSMTVVRVFDRDRAASVHIHGTTVATIGEVDLSPLELQSNVQSFELTTTLDSEMLRGLVAQLAAEVDAHYDTSTLWPTVAPGTFADGERRVTIGAADGHNFVNGMTNARVHGLPWGHKLDVSLEPRPRGAKGYIALRLPAAQIDRVIARLSALAKLV
jgi:hypothetical protein